MRLPGNVNAQQAGLESRFHFLHIDFHREMELAAEGTDLAFADDEVRREFIGGIFSFLPSLLESLDIQPNTILVGLLAFVRRLLRVDAFGLLLRLPGPESRARDD